MLEIIDGHKIKNKYTNTWLYKQIKKTKLI